MAAYQTVLGRPGQGAGKPLRQSLCDITPTGCRWAYNGYFHEGVCYESRDCHHRQRRPLWQRIPVQCPAPGHRPARTGRCQPETVSDVEILLAQGISIRLCKTCTDARGITALPLIEGIEIGTLPLLAQWTLAADKVLTF